MSIMELGALGEFFGVFSGPGRLFWDNIRRATGSEDLEYAAFAEHVNRLIADDDQEAQQ